MNKDIKRYLKNCEVLFPIYTKKEKDFLINLKESILDMVNEYKTIKYDDIVEKFGEPSQIILNFYNQKDMHHIIKK